jgi:hypothetical protein
MADDSFDFAILGATPLAGLVAGLLAEHGKSVCLVAIWLNVAPTPSLMLAFGLIIPVNRWALTACYVQLSQIC